MLAQRRDLGLSFGNPVITKRSSDGRWVALLTSGYNNVSPGDGRGYLYVLDLASGALSEQGRHRGRQHHRPVRPGAGVELGPRSGHRQHDAVRLRRRPRRQPLALRPRRRRRRPFCGWRRCGLRRPAAADHVPARTRPDRKQARDLHRHRPLPRLVRPAGSGDAVSARRLVLQLGRSTRSRTPEPRSEVRDRLARSGSRPS